jgi:hypothetical protein
MLQAADGAANIGPFEQKSAADAASAWWVDYPAIAAADIALQQSWTARVVPLLADGTANATREQVNAVVLQFHPQVLADCQAMANQILNGTATASAAPSTPAPTPAPPVAAAGTSPLANVNWSSVTHPLDCTSIEHGIEIVGTHFFDITGDRVEDAFVQVACQTESGGVARSGGGLRRCLIARSAPPARHTEPGDSG